jgi:DNA-binding response OmpR family regulator
MVETQSTVMVVEDTDALRRLVGYVLRKAGLTVIEMEDGLAAWEAIQVARPSLILLDVRMPRMDGMEFLQRLRADTVFAAVKVVMLTSLSTKSDIAYAESLGISGYLIKPVAPRALVAQVQALLAEAAE